MRKEALSLKASQLFQETSQQNLILSKPDHLKRSAVDRHTSCQSRQESIQKNKSSRLTKSDNMTKKIEKSKKEEIRANIIGINTRYISPFNIELESVYADHTATNRPYQKIQKMVAHMKQFIANPHTQFSHFGKLSTEMMSYTQKSLMKSFSSNQNDFVAIPTGSGSTGAVDKCVRILKVMQDERQSKPAIFITPYQHHSNILPWVQYYEDQIHELASEDDGYLNLNKIQSDLKQCHAKWMFVTISATSNVTSLKTPLKQFNALIKRIRAKRIEVFFALDCAAFCSHDELNLSIYDQVDFAYLSPHKNLGGTESCGILLARKNIIGMQKPTFPGGGTVSFVKGYKKQDILYSASVLDREIAGTPPFLGFYRAALSFELLKQDIGYDFIKKEEKANTQLFNSLISKINEKFVQKNIDKVILIYGPEDYKKRGNVVTFNIFSENNLLHHSLISLMLADIFGIQIRSGCFCAGPYGMKLLHISDSFTEQMIEKVEVGLVKDKPGYLRLDLNFCLELYQVEYIASAIALITTYYENVSNLYTLTNCGKILRHDLFNQITFEKYSLSSFEEVKKATLTEDRQRETRLVNRKEILQKQLNRGLSICSKPLQFLKQQKHVEKLSYGSIVSN